jgi:hypothetical protein
MPDRFAREAPAQAVIPATQLEKATGSVLSLGALIYLFTFVDRAWVPFDEGLIALSAEFAAAGGRPHIDYQDAYTGGLSLLYAALFGVFGTDLLTIRYLAFAASAAALACVYGIARRFVGPVGAGSAVLIAVTWSYPNYFSGLPSWWLLLCSLASTLAYVSYLERRRLAYLVLAGLAAGTAVLFKQTGVYVIVALVLVMLRDWQANAAGWATPAIRFARAGLGIGAVAAAGMILGGRGAGTEGVFLLVPLGAITLATACGVAPPLEPRAVRWHWPVALLATAIPALIFLFPYLRDGQLMALFNGAVVEPRQRLTLVSLSMPSGIVAVASATPVLAFAFVSLKDERRQLTWLWWAIAILLPCLAIIDARPYQAVWHSARTLAVAVPVALAWPLRRASTSTERLALLLATSQAWMAMNQLPFAAPIYFAYFAPLVLLATIASAVHFAVDLRHLRPWLMLCVLFGGLVLNPGWIYGLGERYVRVPQDTPLNLPRAHLRVNSADAATYQQLIAAALPHLGRGRLMAGPDCPEVYFLTGVMNPTGRMVDFLAGAGADERELSRWLAADVIVINHEPGSGPLPPTFVDHLRDQFVSERRIGRFEVRWR